jgi:homoserine dehydrogenase
LMALSGASLARIAEDNGVDLLYEASVGGGIPLIRPLRESLAGEQISQVIGILNGTTNYILTRMTEAGVDYQTALQEAQELGYAEANPKADVEGLDAAAKAAIIANLAFGSSVVAQDVQPEGITAITQTDIELARRLGFVVKLVAVISRHESGNAGVRVHPVMVPLDHPLASVRLSFNAVFVEGEDVGELMFYGRGAGGAPTASAVLGDLIDAAHNLRNGGAGRLARTGNASLWPLEEQSSAFYLTLEVKDSAGVLATVAAAFGQHDVSIRSMEQTGDRGAAQLVFVTHEAVEGNMKSLIETLRVSPVVNRVGNVIRVMEAQ